MGMVSFEDIGVTIVDLIDLLKFMKSNPAHNEECLIFGIRLLGYLNYLCRCDGIDFDAPIYYDSYFCYLMDLEFKHYIESIGGVDDE